ncbi:MAG: chloride channel protein [Rhodocyclaceae bacterium]|nr:chloride channel protein [Rhodocyclaceae bacterium]
MPWLSLRRWRRRAALVGAAMLAGLVAIIFAIGAELAISGHEQLMHISPWLALVIAPAGFAAMAYLSRKYFPGTQGSGIPQTIAASITDDDKLRRALVSPRIMVGKILLTLGGLLSGATIGREGPSVQIGASVLNTLSGRKRGRIAPTRDLVIAGGAAGVAAAFNTPLGGIMFAIEELSRNRPFMANSMTLIAVIFAGLMSLATLGTYTYFGTTHATLAWPYAMWPVIVCGASGGVLGGLFTRLLIKTTRNLPGRLGAFARAFPVRFAALCGLGTAAIGLATAGLSYGTGYAEIKGALEGTEQLPVYYALAKAGAILLAFVSGIPGGLFAPALAVGAGIGANIAPFFPDVQSSAVLALGMVAFLSGVTQSPITAFVIVMEMTANHSLLLPLMCASVTAHAFSRSLAPTPLYDAMAYTILRRYNSAKRGQMNLAAARRQKEERAAAERAAAATVVARTTTVTQPPPAVLEQPAILRPRNADGGFAPQPRPAAPAAAMHTKRGLPPIAAIFKRRDRVVPALHRPPRPVDGDDGAPGQQDVPETGFAEDAADRLVEDTTLARTDAGSGDAEAEAANAAERSPSPHGSDAVAVADSDEGDAVGHLDAAGAAVDDTATVSDDEASADATAAIDTSASEDATSKSDTEAAHAVAPALDGPPPATANENSDDDDAQSPAVDEAGPGDPPTGEAEAPGSRRWFGWFGRRRSAGGR